MLFPIMIKVWAGKDRHDLRYIRRSLPSLFASGLPREARVILVNDQSPDPRLDGFLRSLAATHGNAEVWVNPERMGPNRGQEYNFPRVVERFPEAPYFVLCDDDMIYHPGWLQRLIRVYAEGSARGLRGVYTAINVPFRPSTGTVALPASEVLVKNRQPAFNWLLPRAVYEAVGPFRDAGIAYDTEYCDRMSALGLPVYCMQPSYVQNIGYHGAYQNSDQITAWDYIGRRDLYLYGRDAWYAVNRQTVGLLRDFVERLPDSPWKRGGIRLARRVRSLVREIC